MIIREHKAVQKEGFTLIEMIITIVIIGIAATVSLTYFGTALTQSSNFQGGLMQSQRIESTMEQVVSDYISQVNTDTAGVPNYQNILTTLQNNTYDLPAAGGAAAVTVTMDQVRFNGGNLVSASGTDSDILLRVTVTSGGQSLVNLLSRSRTQNNTSVPY